MFFISKKNKKNGFTLIELMVVVAIIAILSVVGMAVFSSVQQGARNARRRADLDAIAKALEVNKGPTGYQLLLDSQFANGSIPVVDSQGNQYCIGYDNNPVTSTPGVWTGNCPGPNWVVLSGNPVGEPAYWKVCAVLENPSAVYCTNNAQ